MKAIIILALGALGFQPMWGWQVVDSAEAHNVPVETLAGLILSEHRGVLDNAEAAVNAKSGCTGLGQIAPWWPSNKTFRGMGSFTITKESLRIPMYNIEATARVIRIAKQDHARHARHAKHSWLAHYKCGWAGLDGCQTPVRNAKRWIKMVKQELDTAKEAVKNLH